MGSNLFANAIDQKIKIKWAGPGRGMKWPGTGFSRQSPLITLDWNLKWPGISRSLGFESYLKWPDTRSWFWVLCVSETVCARSAIYGLVCFVPVNVSDSQSELSPEYLVLREGYCMVHWENPSGGYWFIREGYVVHLWVQSTDVLQVGYLGGFTVLGPTSRGKSKQKQSNPPIEPVALLRGSPDEPVALPK